MRRKLVITAFLVVLLSFSMTMFESYAFEHGKAKEGQWSFEDKFSHKVKMILSNKEELGLSEEQLKKIKELKMATAKDLIRIKAEIDIAALDIEAAMWGEAADTGALNKLIDKKYDLKKEKDKSLAAACAALKGILTEEQKEKMKGLWKECKKKKHSMEKDKMKCRMMGGEM